MKRRLTNQQRQAIKSGLTLLLSVLLFVGVFMGIPHLVKALPRLSSASANAALSDTRAPAQTVPVFALGSGKREEPKEESSSPPDEESDPEQESEIPQPGPEDLFVTEDNLCWYEIGDAPALNLINRTSYQADLNKYLQNEFPIKGRITSEPLVLIVHTHGSESYLPSEVDFYSPDDDFRSENESQTVVHIGEILCERLNAYGVPTLHDKTMHDVPNYNSSYNNSLAAIRSYLEKYPSIKFVIDLHRDSVFDGNGNNIKPITTIDGKKCAQLMLVMGTNEQGIPHAGWRENLTFATYLQQKLNDMYPTLARPVNLRTAEFNQALTKGSIILEVGSCGNTVEEAENAVLLFAQSYAVLLLSQLD